MFNLLKKSCLLILLTASLAACGTSGGRVTLEEGDAMMKTDRWTKVDSETAAKQIMAQLYDYPAWDRYVANLGHRPKLFIKDVENKTADPYFRIDELNNALLKQISRTGDFVLIDRAQTEKINDELKYQRGGTVVAKDIQKIEETGADTLIFGEITMEPIRDGGQTVKEYTVNIRMTNIRTKEEIARMDYSVTKYTKRGALSW